MVLISKHVHFLSSMTMYFFDVLFLWLLLISFINYSSWTNTSVLSFDQYFTFVDCLHCLHFTTDFCLKLDDRIKMKTLYSNLQYWTQSLMDAEWRLYHLTHAPISFVWFCFWKRVSLTLPWMTSNLLPSCLCPYSAWDYRPSSPHQAKKKNFFWMNKTIKGEE
jgi:hypothetical protein